jgi:hypothetical protein
MTNMASAPLHSSLNDDDLFKKFKLKHHRILQPILKFDAHKFCNDESSSEIDVNHTELLTPDIDELQQHENTLIEHIQLSQVNDNN